MVFYCTIAFSKLEPFFIKTLYPGKKIIFNLRKAMSWCRMFQCFSCCRRSNRVGHDVTIPPKGPRAMTPVETPPTLVLPDVARNIDDIDLELGGFRL